MDISIGVIIAFATLFTVIFCLRWMFISKSKLPCNLLDTHPTPINIELDKKDRIVYGQCPRCGAWRATRVDGNSGWWTTKQQPYKERE